MSTALKYTPDMRIDDLADHMEKIASRLDMIEDMLLDDDFLEELDEVPFPTYEDIASILSYHFAASGSLPAAMAELRELFGLA